MNAHIGNAHFADTICQPKTVQQANCSCLLRLNSVDDVQSIIDTINQLIALEITQLLRLTVNSLIKIHPVFLTNKYNLGKGLIQKSNKKKQVSIFFKKPRTSSTNHLQVAPVYYSEFIYCEKRK